MEIDFVIVTQRRQTSTPAHIVCVEIKSSKKWNRQWEKPMRQLAQSGAIVVDRMICVYTGDKYYKYDNLTVMPVVEFLKALHSGNVF